MRLASVLAATGLLMGCASEANFVMQKDLAEVKQRTVDEMNTVIPHVKPAHLKQCQAMLEQTGLFGEKYKMDGPLSPNIGLSCVAQQRGGFVGLSYLALETDSKVVVFTVPMIKVAGAYGTSWTVPAGACRFSMRRGDPEIRVARQELKAHIADVCRQI